MKTPAGFGFAYHVVATAFGMMLIYFVISLLSFLLSGPGTVPATSTEISVRLKSDTQISQFKSVRDDNMDTLKIKAAEFETRLSLPLSYFKQSEKTLYWLFLIRWMLIWICWLFLLYQLFLVFYDCKKRFYFSEAQVKRMDNATLAMLFLLFLHLLSLTCRGDISSGGIIVLEDVREFSFSSELPLYLIFTAILRGFTAYLKAGNLNNSQTN